MRIKEQETRLTLQEHEDDDDDDDDVHHHSCDAYSNSPLPITYLASKLRVKDERALPRKVLRSKFIVSPCRNCDVVLNLPR